MNVTLTIPSDVAADVFHVKVYLENRLLGALPWALQTILDAVAESSVRSDPFRREIHVGAADVAAIVIEDEYAMLLAFSGAEAERAWVRRAVELAQWTFDQTPVMLAEFEQWRNEFADGYQRDRDAWWTARRARSREEFQRRRQDVA